ncbi:PulJ/GspJ family protein [Mucilaginibacter lacusdianchii]|uniref:PulJ/GspJ family protein n=1 Tax=Mucilaginibacter lacusdianchii TaxID=2684211 RepID=UPI00131A6BF1|nr:hypothetical protein [Mucilaginibacter sp. JXJ CY 39]
MAGYPVKNTKVAASTILEVVVAMVVILAVLGISMMIYANVMRLSLSGQKLRAQFVLAQAMTQLEAGAEIGNTEDTADGWQMEKAIVPYEGSGNLLRVHLTLYDRNHEKLAEAYKIIIRHDPK